MTRLVSKTSPLIVLARAGMLNILPALFSEALIPRAVRDESMAGPPDDPMRHALVACGWLRTIVLDPPLSTLATMQLGKGEAGELNSFDDAVGRLKSAGLYLSSDIVEMVRKILARV